MWVKAERMITISDGPPTQWVSLPKQFLYWTKKSKLTPYYTQPKGSQRARVLRNKDFTIIFRINVDGSWHCRRRYPDRWLTYENLGSIPQTEAEFRQVVFAAMI